MKSIVIGNKGSFLNSLIEKMSEASTVDVYVVDKTDPLYVSKSINFIANAHFDTYSNVLYVSGETRDELCMFFLNFKLPSILMERIRGLKIHFVYLSSLAVFAGNQCDLVNTGTPFAALDNYGQTKILLECYRERYVSDNKLPIVSVIYPASFFSGSGTSSIEQFNAIKSKHLFLKLLKFHGSLSYIRRETLVDEIIDVVNKGASKRIILSENYSLATTGGILSVPVLPMFVFKIFGFLSARLALKLRMVFRGIAYE